MEVVFVIRHSYSAWKLLHRFNRGMCSSRDIIDSILKAACSDRTIWVTHCALIGSNGSAIEYLMYLDELNDNGMISTIATIDEFALWDAVMNNPASGPIIDYVLAHPVNPLFESDSDHTGIRDWVVPLICASENANRYITMDDIESGRVDASFFSNPSALHLVEHWVSQAGLNYKCLSGLVDIACSADRDVAMKAIAIMDSHKSVGKKPLVYGLCSGKLSKLLTSPHAKQYVINTFEALDMSVIITELMYQNKCIPYWSANCKGEWYLDNLTADTVRNADDDFYRQLSEAADWIQYDDWSILLSTERGIQFGLEHITYVIDCGITFALLISPYVSKEQLLQLYDETEAFTYCTDEDFMALVNRADIYDGNLKLVDEYNHELCLEVLSTWHEPSRLCQMASAQGLSVCEYLQST